MIANVYYGAIIEASNRKKFIMSDVIFVRHGQAIGQDSGKVLGATDVGLNETGFEQANNMWLKQYLRNYRNFLN